MRNLQKQSDLEKYRAIVLATLAYFLEQDSGRMVYDQLDSLADYYREQQIQTEKYYQQRRLDRLKQRLATLLKRVQNQSDLTFESYIKEKTGYDIDIFHDVRINVDNIIAQSAIRSQKEYSDVITMVRYHEMTSNELERTRLNELLIRYNEKISPIKSERMEVITEIEKDGIVEIHMSASTGSKPKHLEEQETISPDGKRKLCVTHWSSGQNSSTYITVTFPGASGCVYAVTGVCPEIRASWKDNQTIVIETKKGYHPNSRHTSISSFEDVIQVEYVEVEDRQETRLF